MYDEKEHLHYMKWYPSDIESIVDALNYHLEHYKDASQDTTGYVLDASARELIAIKNQLHQIRWRLAGWLNAEGRSIGKDI